MRRNGPTNDIGQSNEREPTPASGTETLTLPGSPKHQVLGQQRAEEQTAVLANPRDVRNDAILDPRNSEAASGLTVGQSLGRYKLVRVLGSGVMGVVWAAQDPRLDRTIAIKVVHALHAEHEEATTRFLREARAMAKVSDRAVVAIFDAGRADDRLFIAMELINGTTLGEIIRQRRDETNRDWRSLLRIMLQAGQGVAAAHRAGVLHRDLKPDNILVEQNGRVCVGDFGLAQLGQPYNTFPVPAPGATAAIKRTDLELTVPGTVLGTPVYMSPEALRGQDCDARADQFSFCVATYELLYGERPFALNLDPAQPFAPQILAAIASKQIRMPPKESRVPLRIRQILLRGIAADPTDRWSSMDELLRALRQASQRRRPWIAVAVATVGISALAAVVVTRVTPPRAPLRLPTVSIVPNSAGIRLQATHVLDLPHPACVAVAPSGTQIAIVTATQVSTFDIPSTTFKHRELLVDRNVASAEFSNETSIHFASVAPLHLQEWSLAQDSLVDGPQHPTAKGWYGELTLGALLDVNPSTTATTLQVENHPELQWRSDVRVEHVAIAPDRSHFAYLSAGSLAVVDVVAQRITSLPLVEASAVTWDGNHDLLFATGISSAPTLYRMHYDQRGFGRPSTVFQLAKGWIGQLLAANHHIFMVLNNPAFSGSASSADLRGSPSERKLVDNGGFLCWLDDGDWLGWNSDTLAVFRQHGDRRLPTPIVLTGDAANATRDGDRLIVAVRRMGQRELTAYSIARGERLWSLNPGIARAVRCTQDRMAPCFAVTDDEHTNKSMIAPVDSETGNITTTTFLLDRIEDIAISPDGTHIAVAAMDNALREFRVTGELVRTLGSSIATIRTLAYKHADAWFVGGVSRNATHGIQLLEAIEASLPPQLEAAETIISLLRPSLDGKSLQWVRRRFSPQLYELHESEQRSE